MVAIALTACAGQALPVVDIGARLPVPAAASTEVAPIRIAVAAILSPESSFDAYQGIADYLQETIGRPVELVQRRTYREVNDLVATGEVDIAFVCTAAYVFGHDTFGMQLLVAPQIGGSTTYRSSLIVRADSKAASIADLRDAVFAFTDPWSMTGHIYPVSLVEAIGSGPDDFFSMTFYTYSHDRAIAAVADGVADAAAVDSLVLDAELASDPGLGARIRVIEDSREFGIPPVVVSPTTPLTQRALISEALLAMADDPRGRLALARLGFDRFVEIDDAAYEGVRQVISDSGISP